MDGYLGTILLFAGTFAPAGWMFCNGQTLNISTYTALFSLLGTSFGGNGQTTFNLPDLRGRVPVSPGQGPGSAYNYQLGQTAGAESVTLTTQQMPTHNHSVIASAGAQSVDNASNNYLGSGRSSPTIYQTSLSNQTTLNAATIGNQGQSQPHENRQPLVAINYIICVSGQFPARS